ncbi:cystathionine beta-lyase [Herbaspirillum sp. B65]|uniref:cystathionine beta-lyase n=1 Tax=Herbaspirillum sp. B65 TaxID=137708 RepID=UPI00034DD291|nr:cystathionine beta-lyase [Herbaspirillum sp. B65]
MGPMETGHIQTLLTHSGRQSERYHGFVNPPVFHASTVLSQTVQELQGHAQPYVYARRGTPTSEALQTALTELEQAAGVVLCPSGLNACMLALQVVLAPGEHVLVSEGVYRPVRMACAGWLARWNIQTSFYAPSASVDQIARLIGPHTRAIYVEAPGSNTFELPDMPAIVALAQAHGLTVIADNSWATPLFCKPLQLGVDLCIHAGTKYLSGHSDVMLGTVSANPAWWSRLHSLHGDLGLCVGPDDIFLALRGLRTLDVRLQQHQRNALQVAQFLSHHCEVAAVLHPALPGFDGHALWRRDFSGASGLFSVVLQPAPEAAVAAFLNGLRWFGLGYSWGGFESLALPISLQAPYLAGRWPVGSQAVRLHIGLEAVEDLTADLAAGLDRYAQARRSKEE